MKPGKSLFATLFLFAAMGVARAESILSQYVNEAGDLALMHLIPQDDGPWRMEPLELPTIQGLKPNFLDFNATQLVISSATRTRQDETMAWISACYDLSNVVEVLRSKDYLLGLSDHCPYDSHTLAALHRELLRQIETSVGDRADWRSQIKGISGSNAANLFPNLARPEVVEYRTFPLFDKESRFVYQIYLLNYTGRTVTLISDFSERLFRVAPGQVEWGRFVSYSLEDPRHLEIVWSNNMANYDRANRDSQAFVYDTKAGKHIFQSPPFYSTPLGHRVDVNPQGTVVAINRADPFQSPNDPSVVAGPDFIEIHHIGTTSTSRIQLDKGSAVFVRWLPDGRSFIFLERPFPLRPESPQEPLAWYIGNVDGTAREITWTVDGAPGATRPLLAHGVWLSGGRQRVSISFVHHSEEGEMVRQRAKVFLTDVDQLRCHVVAEYDLLVPKRLRGVEWARLALVP
jgi:hypothetical protein